MCIKWMGYTSIYRTERRKKCQIANKITKLKIWKYFTL